MKYNDNGTYKDIYVKAFDTLPIGTEVNFNGTSADIPNGWEQVGTSGNLLIIEKTSQYIEGGATLPNYSTEEIKTGSTWIDGKPIYRKVITSAMPNATSTTTSAYINIDITNLNIDFCKMEGYIATSSSNNTAIIPFPLIVENGTFARIQKYSTDISIYSNSSNMNGRYAYIILEYTKTTD